MLSWRPSSSSLSATTAIRSNGTVVHHDNHDYLLSSDFLSSSSSSASATSKKGRGNRRQLITLATIAILSITILILSTIATAGGSPTTNKQSSSYRNNLISILVQAILHGKSVRGAKYLDPEIHKRMGITSLDAPYDRLRDVVWDLPVRSSDIQVFWQTPESGENIIVDMLGDCFRNSFVLAAHTGRNYDNEAVSLNNQAMFPVC